MASPTLWVDVSNYQGSPNWIQVKSDGVDGAIAKVNEGSSLDPQFVSNWQGIVGAGLRRGAYDFAWTANDPTTEANIFLHEINAGGGLHPDDVLVLDIEQVHAPVATGSVAQWTYLWCKTVQDSTGIAPWIYSYESFITGNLRDARLAIWPLWYAHDPAPGGGPPPCPWPWSQYIAWQYGQGGVPGIGGLVDEDSVYLPPPQSVTHRSGYSSTMLVRRHVSNDGDDGFFKGGDGLLYTFFLKDDNTYTTPYAVGSFGVDAILGGRWNADQSVLTVTLRGLDGYMYQVAFRNGSWGSPTPFATNGAPWEIAPIAPAGPPGPAGASIPGPTGPPGPSPKTVTFGY